MNPVLLHHIRAISARFPGVRCFFVYYGEYWTATEHGFAIVRRDEIDKLAFSLRLRGVTVVLFNDLMEPPFIGLHCGAKHE